MNGGGVQYSFPTEDSGLRQRQIPHNGVPDEGSLHMQDGLPTMYSMNYTGGAAPSGGGGSGYSSSAGKEPWWFALARKLPMLGFYFNKNTESGLYFYHEALYRGQREYARLVVPGLLVAVLLLVLWFVYPYVYSGLYRFGYSSEGAYTDAQGRTFLTAWGDFQPITDASDARVPRLLSRQAVARFGEEQLSEGIVDINVWSRNLATGEPELSRRRVPLEMLRDAMIAAAGKIGSECVCSHSMGIENEGFVLAPGQRFMVYPEVRHVSGGGSKKFTARDPVWMPQGRVVTTATKAIVAYYPAAFSLEAPARGSPKVNAHVGYDTLRCIEACAMI